MTKPKQAKESPSTILYNPTIAQTVPISFEKNGRDIRVTHTLLPLSNDRFFQFERETAVTFERLKNVSTALYRPKESLWDDLVETVSNYKPRDDWKESMPQEDKVAVINGLLHVQVLAENEVEIDDTEIPVYDPDELTEIHFKALQSGALVNLVHCFRQDSKAERDEFLAILDNRPLETSLASAEKLSKSERLTSLGRRLMQECRGYEDGVEVPAWHLATTVETFFARQVAKMGKSLTP